MIRNLLHLAFITILIPTFALAAEQSGQKAIKQSVSPQNFQNYYLSIFYTNDQSTYNLSGFELNYFTAPIIDFKMSPTGQTGAFLTSKKGEESLAIYNMLEQEDREHKFSRKIKDISAICYSKDSKFLYVASSMGVVVKYDTKEYEGVDTMALEVEDVKSLIASSDNYFLVAIDGGSHKVNVLNLQSKKIRKTIMCTAAVTSVAFSQNDSQLAIATDDGVIKTYDTRTFLPLRTIEGCGQAASCTFHPDGKYIAVISANDRILLVNLLDDNDRKTCTFSDGKINKINFVKQSDNLSYLIYNTDNNIVIESVDGLTPYYKQLLKTELNDRMDSWLKMQEGESLEDYNKRVNDETRMDQMLLLEQEIATTLASDLIAKSEVTVGDYNLESNMLAIDFNTMPPIYLEIPNAEAEDFMDTGDLEFKNAKYGVTEDDNFELIYAEIVNKKSGKSYTFDNLKRESLEYLKSDDNYVSLELIKQSNMELIKLESIKEEVVEVAKSQAVISDHTNIKVDANVESAVDADGKNIVNYNINFSYQVEDGFSAAEDFAPGRYDTKLSGAASSMLKIVQTALTGEFSQYVAQGKKLKIDIYGNADALAIHGKIAYSGIYGDLINEPVYKNGKLTTISVTKESGITQNEQLAFLRAWGVQENLLKNIETIKQMDVDVNHYIEVLEGEGGQFRRITVKFSFIDAF